MKPSIAFHSQTDGLMEQTNQTLETYLHTYCSYQQDDWVNYVEAGIPWAGAALAALCY